jgi:hypothetical protein
VSELTIDGDDSVFQALKQLAADWAAPADRPATMTHDEIVEQHIYQECARSLLAAIGAKP